MAWGNFFAMWKLLATASYAAAYLRHYSVWLGLKGETGGVECSLFDTDRGSPLALYVLIDRG